MSHVVLRVHIESGTGTCADKRSGMCAYYRRMDNGWNQPICILFPSATEPFTRLMPIDETGVTRRSDACFRAELYARENEMVTRTSAYKAVQHTLLREDPRRHEPVQYRKAIEAALCRAIAASTGICSAAEILGITRHKLRRLVVAYGLQDELVRARAGAVRMRRVQKREAGV